MGILQETGMALRQILAAFGELFWRFCRCVDEFLFLPRPRHKKPPSKDV
jgi:hypothetical protein